MAESNLPNFSENDPLDINELASLNDDISVDFIEQLQNKLSKEAGEFTGKPVDDGALFEDIQAEEKPLNLRFDESIDDNFIKKYRAKLNKQQAEALEPAQEQESTDNRSAAKIEEPLQEPINNPENVIPEPEPIIPPEPEVVEEKKEPKKERSSQKEKKQDSTVVVQTIVENKEIETLTSGSIVEKAIQQEQIDYNDSLDFLDGNIKYSKYVIYIDPENTEFIDSLTVKERKNLINRLLREQDDIAITKRRLSLVQTVIKHTIVAIITIAISIPVVYYLINASLEASINNHRRSQSMFKTLLNEQGKLKKTPSSHLK